MFSGFNKCLLSDKGKTIVRKHIATMNIQAVWKEFRDHMVLSSKGAAEKHCLHHYVCTTFLGSTWNGSTEQFVLHFHEQFCQLDEVSPVHEHLPTSNRLNLLQNAVSTIP